MMILVFLVETWISTQTLKFVPTSTLSWRFALDAIPQEAARCEIACFGDSLVKIGVIPAVIRERTGRPTYNFAMAQAPATATEIAFRRLIESGGRPSTIIVDFKPSLLAGGPEYSLRHWQSTLTFFETLQLAIRSRRPRLGLEIGLGRLFPSLRDRSEVIESLQAALGGLTAPNHSTNRLAERNWGRNAGAHVNSTRAGFTGEIDEKLHVKLLSDSWRCHSSNRKSIERLMDLAERHRIRVVWLIPPLPRSLQERRERSGTLEAYLDFARSVQARHPSIIVVDGSRSGYADELFADHSHLNGRGSIAMSHDIATILIDPADRSNWVALPAYSDRPGRYPIEDVDQSRIALESEATVR
jgi:hypothetical protein